MTASTAKNYGQTARQWMVDAQLATNKITDPALSASFAAMPREQFVPEAYAQTAYVDEPIPLGNGRFMVEPMVLATWLQALNLTAHDHVLVLGGNLGYAAAIMAPIVADIVLVDDEAFTAKAKAAFSALKLKNITCKGCLHEGAMGKAPYDVMVIEGSIGQVPHAILAQLHEGARACYATPLTPHGHMARVVMVEKRGGVLVERALGEAPVPRLPGFEAPSGFQFG